MSEVPQAADTDAETNDNDSKIVNNVSMHFHGPVTTHNLHAGSGDINASEASPSHFSSEQTKEDCDQLKDFLIEEAKTKCKIDKFFCVDRPINLAPLQITQQQIESAEELGHYHRRKEIAETMSKPPVGDVVIMELFTKANNHATIIASKSQYSNEDAKEHDLNVHGNIVGMIGQAGIGKTTLSKKILGDVVDEDLFDADYVFYLQFRNINYTEKTDLLSFLASSPPLDWVNDKKRRDAVLREISASKSALLIMDGFDEAKLSSSVESPPSVRYNEDTMAEVFIKNIFQGTILSKTRKIVTSRPRQLLEISNEFRPSYIVNILGLDLEAQYEICKSLCESNTDPVFNYIQHLAPIASYCYVPATCILVMHSIYSIRISLEEKAYSYPMPNSITGVLVVVVCLFVTSPHARDLGANFPLEKLTQLAWEGFSNKTFSFSEGDFIRAGITREELHLFLVTTLTKNHLSVLGGDPSKITYFAHLIIQEFFVAVHLIFFTPAKEFQRLFLGSNVGALQFSKPLYDLNSNDWEMVTMFLFGLSNENTFACLKDKFPSLSSNLTEKASMLHEFALRTLPKSSSFEHEDYFENVLRVCIWAFELNDKGFAAKVAKQLSKSITITGKILPSDVSPIHFVLRERKSPLHLDVTDLRTWFVGDSIHEFLKEMKKTSISSPVTIEQKKLDAHADKAGDSYNLSQLIREVDTTQEFRAPAKFGKTGFEMLASAIKQRTTPMTKVYLTDIDVNDDKAAFLASCLHNIEKLEMWNCNLTPLGVDQLTKAIKFLPKPMKFLELSQNSFGDKGAESLASCIHKVEILVLRNCDITSGGAKNLAKALKESSQSLKYFNLSANNIGDDGFVAIASCISRIEMLEIGSTDDEKLSMKGIRALSKAVQLLDKPMKLLRLSYESKLKTKVPPELKLCLSKCEELKPNAMYL